MIRHRASTLAAPLLVCATLLAAPTPGAAQAPADFFKGKTVNIEIGFPPGGGYDTYGRVLSRHLGKYIPGNPTVVAKNMPGAGALKAANFMYAAAPKDGTEIGIVASSTLMEPLLGNDQAQFDAAKFGWLGSMSKDIAFCGITTASGVAGFDDWLKGKKELIFGSSGPAAITHQHPLVMKNLLGANAKIISGYQGTKDISLAMERKEVDGICGMFISSVQTSYKPMIDAGVMRLIIQMGPVKSDIFGKIPSVYDYAKSDLDRQVLDIHFGQLLLARPFMVPPGVPADRLAALRKAFADTLKDKDLLADAQKAQIEIELVTPDEVQGMLAKFADYPQASIKAAQKAIDR
jgi:tripartite-type tricarboxylate transporter receptor subunit TctC